MRSYIHELWSGSGEITHEGRLGIIDIGSNSIRLVVYDAVKRSPLPLFNEKVFCGLAKGLALTGKLNPAGVKLAQECIRRFLALVRIMDVVELQIIATAAVRDASDGTVFVEKLEKEHRVNITVISGRKEASLAAGGIFSSFHKPEGLAGDLGGGSIELISLGNGRMREQTTIPIGPLRLIDMGKGDKAKTARMIRDAFEAEPWLRKERPPHFYAIGGSFRALAHIHMKREKYPLDIMHHYTVKTPLMRKFLKELLEMPSATMAKLPGVSGRRFESMVPAAQVMLHVLDITHPADVIFSASGIREGYLYEKLSPALRAEDPLIASCTDLAAQHARPPGYARELFHWMTPLFKGENEMQRRLRFCACIVGEIVWRIHPDYRAEAAYHRILQSTLSGLSHPDRVSLALMLYHRHQAKLKLDYPALALLKEKDKAYARLVGNAASLAFQLSGGMAGNLGKTSVAWGKGGLKVTFRPEAEDLLSEQVQKRIGQLGEML